MYFYLLSVISISHGAVSCFHHFCEAFYHRYQYAYIRLFLILFSRSVRLKDLWTVDCYPVRINLFMAPLTDFRESRVEHSTWFPSLSTSLITNSFIVMNFSGHSVILRWGCNVKLLRWILHVFMLSSKVSISYESLNFHKICFQSSIFAKNPGHFGGDRELASVEFILSSRWSSSALHNSVAHLLQPLFF